MSADSVYSWKGDIFMAAAKTAKPWRETIKYPCSEEEFKKISDIVSGLRDLDGEFLIVNMEGYPTKLNFIQTTRSEDGDKWLIEAAVDCGKKKPQMLRIPEADLPTALKVFREICMDAKAPDKSIWTDVTKEIFFRRVTMKIFKAAYNVVRKNSDEIFKGFGFRHLSDATQYYVHPDNQSFKGTTTLCQPIGESVILFAEMLTGMARGKLIGDYYVNDDSSSVYLEINIPAEYRENGVVSRKIYRYRALANGAEVSIGAYDKNDKWIDGDMEHLHPLYKLLPAFLVLLGREMETNSDYRTVMENFIEAPVADSFVNLHEDFYQNHKIDDVAVSYIDISDMNIKGWHPFSEAYAVIRQNKEAALKKEENPIIRFPEDAFSEEQKELIPKLSDEFVLPENLGSICSAIASGDILSVLFHGPAGTGKTMSCKLAAQATGLPVMETVNCTENLDEFVLGKFIPEDDRIVFHESYVTKAIREGGAVVFEEINFAKPQYLAFLNSLLDDNGFVRLDNGEVVKRNPNFRFFATMNMGYFGTKDLNQALYNRFNAIVEIAALSDEAISRMLTARVPECEPMVDKILGVYHKIKKKVEAEELDVVISPRNLENWARLAKYDGYIKAAEKTIIPVAKCDRALEDTIRGIMMLYKWTA